MGIYLFFVIFSYTENLYIYAFQIIMHSKPELNSKVKDYKTLISIHTYIIHILYIKLYIKTFIRGIVFLSGIFFGLKKPIFNFREMCRWKIFIIFYKNF